MDRLVSRFTSTIMVFLKASSSRKLSASSLCGFSVRRGVCERCTARVIKVNRTENPRQEGKHALAPRGPVLHQLLIRADGVLFCKLFPAQVGLGFCRLGVLYSITH